MSAAEFFSLPRLWVCVGRYISQHPVSRWRFQIFFIFIPIWGRFPFLLIFFQWVGSTTHRDESYALLSGEGNDLGVSLCSWSRRRGNHQSFDSWWSRSFFVRWWKPKDILFFYCLGLVMEALEEVFFCTKYHSVRKRVGIWTMEKKGPN